MLRVLVVHPDEAIRELATRTMQRMGVGIDIASSAREASFLLAQGSYAAIVVDFTTTGAILHDPALRAEPKPAVVVHAPADFDSSRLDPELTTLVVTAGDAATVVGVVLSYVVEEQPDVIPPEFLSSRPSRMPEA